jgi:hypothetical protein
MAWVMASRMSVGRRAIRWRSEVNGGKMGVEWPAERRSESDQSKAVRATAKGESKKEEEQSQAIDDRDGMMRRRGEED